MKVRFLAALFLVLENRHQMPLPFISEWFSSDGHVHAATMITPAELTVHEITVGYERCHGCVQTAPSLLILSEKPSLRCQGNLNQTANND